MVATTYLYLNFCLLYNSINRPPCGSVNLCEFLWVFQMLYEFRKCVMFSKLWMILNTSETTKSFSAQYKQNPNTKIQSCTFLGRRRKAKKEIFMVSLTLRRCRAWQSKTAMTKRRHLTLLSVYYPVSLPPSRLLFWKFAIPN